MSVLTTLETENAKIARRVVATFGGKISFADYDKAMKRENYFVPLSWCAGWGDRVLFKENNDKLCAFAACKIGLLEQTSTGYKIP